MSLLFWSGEWQWWVGPSLVPAMPLKRLLMHNTTPVLQEHSATPYHNGLTQEGGRRTSTTLCIEQNSGVINWVPAALSGLVEPLQRVKQNRVLEMLRVDDVTSQSTRLFAGSSLTGVCSIYRTIGGINGTYSKWGTTGTNGCLLQWTLMGLSATSHLSLLSCIKLLMLSISNFVHLWYLQWIFFRTISRCLLEMACIFCIFPHIKSHIDNIFKTNH